MKQPNIFRITKTPRNNIHKTIHLYEKTAHLAFEWKHWELVHIYVEAFLDIKRVNFIIEMAPTLDLENAS